MQLTPNYKLKKPEGTDPVDIQDFNDNADLIDAALKKKAETSGGDISEMTVKTLDTITTEFPVPVAGESQKSFLGKVKKFFEDTKNWMSGVCLIGQIVNNCVTNNAKLPLSAAQGKVLMDLYTVLNNNFEKYYSLSDAIQISSGADLNNYTEFGNYVSSEASVSSTLKNCPALNAGFVLHVERVTGSRDGTFLKQRIIYNEAKSLEFWRVKTGKESWSSWVSPITNAELISKTITLDEINMPANSRINMKTTDVSGQSPSGYKILVAVPRATGDNACYYYYVDFSGTKINYQLRNIANIEITITPSVKAILIKE